MGLSSLFPCSVSLLVPNKYTNDPHKNMEKRSYNNSAECSKPMLLYESNLSSKKELKMRGTVLGQNHQNNLKVAKFFSVPRHIFFGLSRRFWGNSQLFHKNFGRTSLFFNVFEMRTLA